MFATHSASSERRRLAETAAIVLLAGFLSVGCTPAQDPVPAPAGDAPPAPAAESAQDRATPSPEAATVGGDGSAIRLETLTADDVAGAELGGELACGFFADDEEMPILHATGIVASDDPARGIVKVSGYVEPVRAPGGFNGIVDGPTFSGRGKTIEIAVTGAAIGGGESPPRPATLTYLRADGASRGFEGRWQCGP